MKISMKKDRGFLMPGETNKPVEWAREAIRIYRAASGYQEDAAEAEGLLIDQLLHQPVSLSEHECRELVLSPTLKPRALACVGLSLAEQGRYDEALKVLHEAINALPEGGDPTALRARVEARINQFEAPPPAPEPRRQPVYTVEEVAQMKEAAAHGQTYIPSMMGGILVDAPNATLEWGSERDAKALRAFQTQRHGKFKKASTTSSPQRP